MRAADNAWHVFALRATMLRRNNLLLRSRQFIAGREYYRRLLHRLILRSGASGSRRAQPVGR